MKGKLQITKRFSKFYITDFLPLTRLEEADVQRSRNFYNTAVIVGAVSAGFMSFRMRSVRLAMLKPEEAPRDMNFALNVLNDSMAGIIGFFLGHVVGCDYIYKHR
jgi:hypothetical protein